jgi:integrase/recombinase XerD
MVELSNWRLCLQTSGIYRDSAIPACNVKVKTGGAAAGCSPPRPGQAPEISAQVASLQSLILCSGPPQSKLPLNKLPTLNSEEAILETFYSTGMRRTELVKLTLYDVDLEAGIVTIREGKGRKDRVIPIGERAVAWLDKYLDQARPKLVVEPDEMYVFLAAQGEQFSRNSLSIIIREYVESAKIGKRGACHLFRHTMATLMLEGGADIRFIQQMLGHARLDTTQIYTHVSIRMLKQIHSATHPAAALKRAVSGVTVEPSATSAELFAELGRESDEEDLD